MPELSAFIITKNEAADIPACLQSLRTLAEDIVVVDSHSIDGTPDLCRQLGARVYSRVFDGFGPQKQFALDQTLGEWVLSIDADERVSPALAYEIRMAMRSSSPYAGYEVRRNFYFLGHHLRFGGQGGDWVLRLFRRDRGSVRPVKVHERIEVRGEVGKLNNPLEHYSYSTLSEYVEKCNHYTTLAAQEQWAMGRRFSWFDYLRPGWELFSRVVLKGAWLDGQPGLTYASLSAHAAWLRAIKLKEIAQSGKIIEDVLPHPSGSPTKDKGRSQR